MYEVPLIYDPLAFVLIIFCNIVTVCNFLRKTIPSRQTIRSFSKFLEGINLLLLCCYPYLYNCNQFLILRSGDVELNPGPINLKICHINIRSLSPVKLMAIWQDIADKFNIITLSETFLNRESSHNLEILGFHPIFRRDRGSFGGGVACYVGSNLVAKRRGDKSPQIWDACGSKSGQTTTNFCYAHVIDRQMKVTTFGTNSNI